MFRLRGGGSAARSARGTGAADSFRNLGSPRQKAGRSPDRYEGPLAQPGGTTATSAFRSPGFAPAGEVKQSERAPRETALGD